MSASKVFSIANPGDSRAAENVLREIREVLQSLERQRREIVKKICTIKQTVMGLASLYGNEVFDDQLLEIVGRKNHKRRSGLTKTCRMVLIQAGRPLTAREACNQIMIKNPSLLVGHKHPMATVNTLLNRLAEYGEAQVINDEAGKRSWQWATASTPLLAQPADVQ